MPKVTFDVTFEVEADFDQFYWDSDKTERIETVRDALHNALWELDNFKINNMELNENE